MNLSVGLAQLIALLLEALLLGIHIATSFPCFKALLWRNDAFLPFQSIRWTMLIVCLLLATFSIMDVSIEFYHVAQAFAEGTIAKFAKISDWTHVTMVIDAQLFMGYFG